VANEWIFQKSVDGKREMKGLDWIGVDGRPLGLSLHKEERAENLNKGRSRMGADSVV